MINVAATLGGTALAGLPAWREMRRRPLTEDDRADAPGLFLDLSRGATHFDWLGPGYGPVAVCVHGLTTPSDAWRALAQPLARKGYRVLIYDLYGRGYSDRPRGAQTLPFFAAQLAELLDALDVREGITLLGYSMGGAIAAQFAADHPEKIDQLVLVAPAGMSANVGGVAQFSREWPLLGDWLFHMGYPASLRRSIRAEAAQPCAVPRLAETRQQQLLYRGYLRSVLSSLRYSLRRPLENTHRTLAEAGLPVTAIWGRDDDVIPLRALGQLSQWNRHARQAVIDGAGHGLVYTHPDEVALHIEAPR